MRTRMMDKRMKKLELLEAELQEPEFIGAAAGADGPIDTLLVGWGSTYGPIAEAVEILNATAPGASATATAALVFGDVFPLPTKRIKELAAKAKRVINIEQNATGQLAGMIREYAGVEMTGSILKYDGRQISAEEIAKQIAKEAKS